MAKPNNALQMAINCDFTEAAMDDAISTMNIHTFIGAHLFTLTMSENKAEYQRLGNHRVVNKLNKEFDNMCMQMTLDDDYKVDEWCLTHVESGKCVWSPGA